MTRAPSTLPNREGKAISSRRSRRHRRRRRRRRRRHILWRKLSIHHFKKREKKGALSLTLVEDTLHTFGWGLKGPSSSSEYASRRPPRACMHILSGEGGGGGGGEWGHEKKKKKSLAKLYSHISHASKCHWGRTTSAEGCRCKKYVVVYIVTTYTGRHRFGRFSSETCRRGGGRRRSLRMP